MARNKELQQLIETIHHDLDLNDQRVSSIVRKAFRLAHLTGELEYRSLFQLHLDGLDLTDDGSRILKWPDQALEPKWDIVRAFMADRSWVGGQALGQPLEQMEFFLDRCHEDRERLEATKKRWDMVAKLIDTETNLSAIFVRIRTRVATFLVDLEGRLGRPNIASPSYTKTYPIIKTKGKRIFIGHGRSKIWMDLRDFLVNDLSLLHDEFNREATAGKTTVARLEEMLANSCFAFLVLTAEDSRADGTEHARENVIHEVGLFQGRLGFQRAIILLEDGCSEFSNIHGLTQIRFPRTDLRSALVDIRNVLAREGLVQG